MENIKDFQSVLEEKDRQNLSLMRELRVLKSKSTDLTIYRSNCPKVTEFESIYEPEPKLDELYLKSKPARDHRDDKIDELIKES